VFVVCCVLHVACLLLLLLLLLLLSDRTKKNANTNAINTILQEAVAAHQLVSDAFATIGDKPHAMMAQIDAASEFVSMSSSNSMNKAHWGDLLLFQQAELVVKYSGARQ